MSKITQSDRHEMFAPTRWFPKTFSWKEGVSQHPVEMGQVNKSSKGVAQNVRDASDPSADDYSRHQKWSQWKSDCQPAYRRLVEKAEICQTTQELDWRSHGFESKFEIFGSNHCQYVWMRPGERHNSECLQTRWRLCHGLGLSGEAVLGVLSQFIEFWTQKTANLWRIELCCDVEEKSH